MLDFTFLTEEQIENLNIFDIFSPEAEVTDYSILLGAEYSVDILNSKLGAYWLKNCDGKNDVLCLESTAVTSEEREGNEREIGARLVVFYPSIKNECIMKKKIENGILEIYYGEYPQKAVSDALQKELNDKFSELTPTSKKYTVDSEKISEFEKGFKPKDLIEYEYKGKKYVRVETNTYFDSEIGLMDGVTLSNGKEPEFGDYVWVEVEPVNWLVDEKENIAVSDKILFAGIQFNKNSNYNGNFKNTDIKKYIDEYFSKEIIPSAKININKDKKIDLKNAYDFDFENVAEEELIKGSLESNLAPFLHGKSSEGKSARIKQFDPDAEIVYLRNATPDSLNGKSVYNAEKNEMIDVPPTWYIKLKEKCEKEPDKLHIVFFDELTNALPSIQGMAFNIILDKEINGKWKLPENARVAAAGNDLEDSLAANTMAEPLFNRFNHVYINTTVDDWLKWALIPNDSYERLDYKKTDTSKQPKIHPAIYAYIACKKESVLRTKFTGIKPNADPRKWEMASKVLYKTNNPYMLRGLIGEELTNDFVAFCQTKVITINDVINGNYSDEIFKINSSEKYLTTLALSNVEEENVEVIRLFIERLGKDFLALFDSLWTMGNDERLETLMSLKQGRVKIKK